jgi:hypothetical protein
MKRFDQLLVNMASVLLGLVCSFLCFEALFVAVGRLVDGEDFGSPSYTDYGLGMLALFVCLPLLAILTYLLTRTFRKYIGNHVINIRKRSQAANS